MVGWWPWRGGLVAMVCQNDAMGQKVGGRGLVAMVWWDGGHGVVGWWPLYGSGATGQKVGGHGEAGWWPWHGGPVVTVRWDGGHGLVGMAWWDSGHGVVGWWPWRGGLVAVVCQSDTMGQKVGGHGTVGWRPW